MMIAGHCALSGQWAMGTKLSPLPCLIFHCHKVVQSSCAIWNTVNNENSGVTHNEQFQCAFLFLKCSPGADMPIGSTGSVHLDDDAWETEMASGDLSFLRDAI